MTSAVPPGTPDEGSQRQPDASAADGALQLLAAVSRALAGLPTDADDGLLLSTLADVLVPHLGDVCHLHAVDATGDLRLTGTAPSDTELARRLPAVLEEYSVAMAVYESLLDAPGPVRVLAPDAEGGDIAAANDSVDEHASALRAAGLASEIVIPLHTGRDGDALLGVGRSSPEQPGGPAIPGTGDLLLAEVLGFSISAWRTTREVRRREAPLQERIDELVLAGRELAHSVNNTLTMPVGTIELLMDRSTLSPELQEMVAATASDLAALERHVQQFQEKMRAHTSERRAP